MNIDELEEQGDDGEEVVAEIESLKSKKADLEKKQEVIQQAINEEVHNHVEFA